MTMTTVAVAVRGRRGGRGGSGSRRAVRWAVENLMPQADRFILVHVMPEITSIPTPSGNHISVKDLDANVVATYVQDMRMKYQEIFIPFKKLCKTDKVETLVLEDADPAVALCGYMSESNISTLVMGSCPSNCILRKLKGAGLPSTVLRFAPGSCDIYIVSRHRIISKWASSSTSEYSSRQLMPTQRQFREGSCGIDKQISWIPSSIVESNVHKTFQASSKSKLRCPNCHAFMHKGSCTRYSIHQDEEKTVLGDSVPVINTVKQCSSSASLNTEQSDVQAEVEELRLELKNTVFMYKRACEELVLAQNKERLLSSECLEEARRINTALEREETLRKIATEEKTKYLEALKEVEMAKSLLAKETYERQIAERRVLKESSEKQKVVDALFSSDKRYRRYSSSEIEVATNFFSNDNVIGEGGYGKVYRCSLDHTPVAIKVLHSDASTKKEEFLREVKVLSHLHHRHLILLLGACPEKGCLVYEYMENGSLEEHIFQKNGRPPLPWFVRFRIVFEVACGLAFLHGSKPEPIVHRDLKPGNILLDRNYVSKIGDVGMAKLLSNAVPDNVTEYRDTVLAGTFFYMDPEYQRTGTLRPKSDLYAFGIIILQLLAARPPNGLLLTIENSITSGSFADVLDKSVIDWPLSETEELVHIALKCCNLRCRDRPDLETEVLPALKRLADMADASTKVGRDYISAPSHYFCPILQEVMDDPYIAADGFSYEHVAIEAWLRRHNVSPVTKLMLQHTMITPNLTLHSAIQEWRSQVTFSSA